ncbi:uncharacterized protein LOC122046765 isoform X2 [Zingiber officinale]|uniref:uncharacterized protein LOC122046765 isoform X2 n=1 Tax=Zingiber officinale TaxID=94328 RepID=UPI001C4BF7BA|nr:uncharacterized protein LOC122046765 isoform X2 [Zingiber officinale]
MIDARRDSPEIDHGIFHPAPLLLASFFFPPTVVSHLRFCYFPLLSLRVFIPPSSSSSSINHGIFHCHRIHGARRARLRDSFLACQVRVSPPSIRDGRVVSDEQVRGVGRSEVRKRYGSCNGRRDRADRINTCNAEWKVLKRDIIAVIQRFNIQVSNLTQDVLGKSSSTVYAIALLASGQSSTITGTYAGPSCRIF